MFKSTWTLYSRHHIEIKLNILSNAPFFIAFFASTAVTTLRTNIWDALVCAWHRYAVVIPNKKKRDQLQYQNSREQALYSDATNSFGSSCQIFPSFLWGQENIGLAADALVSWSLWERCLAAVATFRPRVSWSLGESWQSQSEFHQARSRHRPTTFKQPLVSIWHPRNSSRSSSGPDFSIGDRFIDICFSRRWRREAPRTNSTWPQFFDHDLFEHKNKMPAVPQLKLNVIVSWPVREGLSKPYIEVLIRVCECRWSGPISDPGPS